MKHWFKYLLVLILVSLSGWVIWLYLTATSAPLHPYFVNSSFETIAHRGGRDVMPENTMAAFFHSDQSGVDVLEMDIRLTKDQQIVVIHDRKLDRTTNCSGFVSHYDLSELLDCGMKAKQQLKQQKQVTETPQNKPQEIRIPTLKEVFQNFRSKRMVIEIKDSDPVLVTNFCKLIKRFKKQSQILVGSFSQSVLDQFREICPEVATSASPKETLQFFLLSKLRLSGLISPKSTALLMPWRMRKGKENKFFFLDIITPSLVQQAHSKNLAIQIWTVNDTQEMDALIKLGIDGIMTDYPGKLIELTKKQ